MSFIAPYYTSGISLGVAHVSIPLFQRVVTDIQCRIVMRYNVEYMLRFLSNKGRKALAFALTMHGRKDYQNTLSIVWRPLNSAVYL